MHGLVVNYYGNNGIARLKIIRFATEDVSATIYVTQNRTASAPAGNSSLFKKNIAEMM